ncbi:MAG: hypothetical protein LBV21_06185 [Candidatus Adiutrix sp.]|nr:hypothetical protein [Candidatus Adiutrix sp.]
MRIKFGTKPGLGCRDQASGLFHLAHFRSALERELARLDHGDRPLSLALVDLPRAQPADWAAFGRLARAALRPIDLAARLSERRTGFLFPESSAARTRRWRADFLADLGRDDRLGGLDFKCGLALAQPWEGLAAGELLAQAAQNISDDGSDAEAPCGLFDPDPATAIATDERGLLFDGFKALEGGRRP